MKHLWQILIIAISWKYVRRRPIRFVTAPHVGAFHSPAIFALLHWSFMFKHQTLLCCCLILVTISVGRKSKDRSFWWRSLHEVSTSRRRVLDDQWRRYTNYSCTCIPVDGPPTRVRVSGSLLALLTYEYPGGYGLKEACFVCVWIHIHALTPMYVHTLRHTVMQMGILWYMYTSMHSTQPCCLSPLLCLVWYHSGLIA